MMGTGDSENNSSTLKNVGELCQLTAENMETNSTGKSCVNETGENGQDLTKEKSLVVQCATQKEAIEILKVEVVTPRLEGHINRTDAECLESENVYEEYSQPLERSNSPKLSEDILRNELTAEPYLKISGRDTLNKVITNNNSQDITSNAVESINIVTTSVTSGNTMNEDITQNELTVEANFKINEMYNIDEEMDNTKQHDFTRTISECQNVATTSGLGLLAQYESDNEDKNSDSESVIEVPLASAQNYRNQVIEIDSDSDSDSDSDDSSDSSDVEYLEKWRKKIDNLTKGSEEDKDGNEENKKSKQKLKVKGEMDLDDLPPIQDLKITVPENECIEFGKVQSIVNQIVVVTALPNAIILDLDSVIFLEKGEKVLGEVFDVMGRVNDPRYCVRFNSNEHIKEKQINVGDIVYIAPKTKYTQYVILANLLKQKGSDASWENDIEPPPRFLDYSDDEQEQFAKRQLRNKDRPVDNDDYTKRSRIGDDENSSAIKTSNNANTKYNKRNHREGPSGSNYNNPRPRHNTPQHYQRGPNYDRSSWHSNYYPQAYAQQPSSTYGMRPIQQGHPQSSQLYTPHSPMYAMPHLNHSTLYQTPYATQYVTPPMMYQHGRPQLMPNSFDIRPPTTQGPPPHVSHQQQYPFTPQPPPGSQ